MGLSEKWPDGSWNTAIWPTREAFEAHLAHERDQQRMMAERAWGLWCVEAQRLLETGQDLYPPPPNPQNQPETWAIAGVGTPHQRGYLVKVRGWETREPHAPPTLQELTQQWGTCAPEGNSP